jgi:hypothetical protein
MLWLDMTKEQLIAAVGALVLCSTVLVYLGNAVVSRLYQHQPIGPGGDPTAPARPETLQMRSLACDGVPAPKPGDVEIVLKHDGSVANRVAALRLICQQ